MLGLVWRLVIGEHVPRMCYERWISSMITFAFSILLSACPHADMRIYSPFRVSSQFAI